MPPANSDKSQSRREDDLEITGPLGWRVKASGRQTSWLVIVLVAMLGLGYMLRDHDMKSMKAIEVAVADRHEQMTAIVSQQTKLQDNLDTLVYVMLLSESERARLKLDMPQSLRTKLLGQDRGR